MHLLQAVLEKAVDGKKIHLTSFAIRQGTFVWHGAAGDLSVGQSYFIASTTKLFTTALILRLQSEDRLSLDDKIGQYLDPLVLDGLHVYKGRDYASELTIKHLLAHTSGLPDYFQNKGPNGKSLEDEIVGGNDQSWTFGQAIDRTKSMEPLFPPGTRGKAHYSDANFQLLGKIIETITAKTYAENCQVYIIGPLGLSHTYLYQDTADHKPKTLYYGSDALHISQAMTSFGADGGIVSTTADMLVFIEAFFTGKLFPAAYLNDLQQWNNIFFPLQAGVGIHKFQLPRLFDPTGAVPYLIGHSGLSGALAFYSPEKKPVYRRYRQPGGASRSVLQNDGPACAAATRQVAPARQLLGCTQVPGK
ncbi:MAG: hypothetical protein OHK0039_06060 [Bacteroidia bacterium]